MTYEKYDEMFEQYNKADFVKMAVRVNEIKKSSAERMWYKIRARLRTQVTIQPTEVSESPEVSEVRATEPHLHRFIEEDKEQPNALKMLELKDLMFYLKGHLTRSKLLEYKWNNLQINFLIDSGYNVEDK